MAGPIKQERQQHPVRWEQGDWERILEAADLLASTDPLQRVVSPTDVIRNATRRYLDELLGPKSEQPAKAS